MAGALRFLGLEGIVGDMVRVRARGAAVGELALVESRGRALLARVIELDGEQVALQVFAGARGVTSDSSVRFLGRTLEVTCSQAILGRIFDGTGVPADGGPMLSLEPRIEADGPGINPLARTLPSRMIETGVPMIDVFNCLVESQKIPIFSVPGEPHNQLLARIGFQAHADVVVFVGLALAFDDFSYFRRSFEAHGASHRTVMFVNLASDPVVERIVALDLALAVAGHFAVVERRRVLVLATDMTAYADALKEIGLALERIPANRGYLGDLYTQLATRYERACNFEDAGSVTILAVTTVPGNDITHPVPDNTGYITEGQIYLRDGMIDPFASLSRLKQHVIGKRTREDHGPLANALVRLYAIAVEAERKRAMAFELNEYDLRLLAFGEAFRRCFMRVDAAMPLELALDEGWRLLGEHFSPHEIPIRSALVEKHLPRTAARAA